MSCVVDTTNNSISVNVSQEVGAGALVTVTLTNILNPTKTANMGIAVTTYNNATLGVLSTINRGNSSLPILFSSRTL